MALTSQQVSSDMDTILSGMVSTEEDYTQGKVTTPSDLVACISAVAEGYAVELTGTRFPSYRITLKGVRYVEGLTPPAEGEDDG